MKIIDILFGPKRSGVPRSVGIDDMVPDASLAEYVGGGDAELFKSVGNQLLGRFRQFCDLKPDESVLEVGCGIGRVAIPLTQYLTTGKYVGFDIVPHGIEWCQRKITPRYPNFRFFVADVHNRHYHPQGRHSASEYKFPFDDGTFDFVFLTSVFTHMLPKDVEQYATEIGRVLKSPGRCFCTAYVVSEEALAHLSDGTSLHPFVAYPEGHWAEIKENPEASVAYSDEFLASVFKRGGLTISETISGEWWKNQTAQDALIVRKP